MRLFYCFLIILRIHIEKLRTQLVYDKMHLVQNIQLHLKRAMKQAVH